MSERAPFVPNAVLIPDEARWKDGDGSHVDPTKCALLYIDGNRRSAHIYEKDAWEKGGYQIPSYYITDGSYYRVADPNSEEAFSSDELPLLEGTTIELLPEMWCVKEDETGYWGKDLLEKYGITRIFGVYVFDRRCHHHLCELTPSYERRFMGSQWQVDCEGEGWDSHLADATRGQEDPCEAIDEQIRDGDLYTEAWSYMHVGEVDRSIETIIRQGCFPPEGRSAGGYPITGLVSVTTADAILEILEGTCNYEL